MVDSSRDQSYEDTLHNFGGMYAGQHSQFFLFSAVWIFCYDSPGEKSGWVRYILEKGSKGDYNTSLAGLFVSALSAFVYLVMSILAYRFFKHIETQRTPITDSAIAKLRRTGIWIILLQALLLGDSFAMKLLLEYQRK